MGGIPPETPNEYVSPYPIPNMSSVFNRIDTETPSAYITDTKDSPARKVYVSIYPENAPFSTDINKYTYCPNKGLSLWPGAACHGIQ